MKLNDRELEIVRQIAAGKTTAEIAANLSLSPETIKWYRKKLLAKFEACNSAMMVKMASEAGLLF